MMSMKETFRGGTVFPYLSQEKLYILQDNDSMIIVVYNLGEKVLSQFLHFTSNLSI
jgi:hypothetical protein